MAMLKYQYVEVTVFLYICISISSSDFNGIHRNSLHFMVYMDTTFLAQKKK